MVEINTYEAKRLNANKNMMKTVVILCVLLIAVTFLYNQGLIGENISRILFAIIIVGGILYLGYLIMDMYNRDNMNYDEYEFDFDPEAAKARLDDANKNNGDAGGCINNNCCSDGTVWDQALYKCVPGDGASPTTSGDNNSGNAEGFTTSGFSNLKNSNNSNKELEKQNIFSKFSSSIFSSNKTQIKTDFQKPKVAAFNNDQGSFASY